MRHTTNPGLENRCIQVGCRAVTKVTAGVETKIKTLPVARRRRHGRDFFRFFVFAWQRLRAGGGRNCQSATQKGRAETRIKLHHCGLLKKAVTVKLGTKSCS